MKTTKHLPILRNRVKQLLSTSVLIGAIALWSTVSVHAEQTDSKVPAKAVKAKAASKVAKPAVAKAQPASTTTTKKVVVTGSRIPREVKTTGNLHETTSPVYVVDQKEIERSGAMTTADLLRRLPFVR